MVGMVKERGPWGFFSGFFGDLVWVFYGMGGFYHRDVGDALI